MRQGLVGSGEDLGFDPERGGSPRGLCTEGRGPTQVLVSAPCGCFREDRLGVEGGSPRTRVEVTVLVSGTSDGVPPGRSCLC